MANTIVQKQTGWLLDGYDGICKSVALGHSRVLYGINVDVRPSRARIILKTFTGGRAEIAFINASDIERCLEVLEAFVTTNANVGVKWKPDKYYQP